MDVFALRERLTYDYSTYASSFIHIRDERIHEMVQNTLNAGDFWPTPLIQLNPTFESGGKLEELIAEGLLHPECASIFVRNKLTHPQPIRFHRHQREAIETARQGHHYVLTTGTGSGKSLAYIVPIVDHVLRRGSRRGIQAIIVYPMNALANSQMGELKKFLVDGYPEGKSPVTFARYTGQESETDRQTILNDPPDILLTNYVMLELLMTRPRERRLIQQAEGLRFLVLDELHTYRGRQGADVALLMRRVRNRLETGDHHVQFVGTSATLAGEGSHEVQRAQVETVGTQLFGVPVQHVIGETLRRTTAPFRDDQESLERLRGAAGLGDALTVPNRFIDFVTHPLSQWLETTFGLGEVDGRLMRRSPRSIDGENGAAKDLAKLTGQEEPVCALLIRRWLLGGYSCETNPETGLPPFAFRLHQFISPGDTVYATVEPESDRYLTLIGQQFVPGDSQRERVLLPLCFCRDCGQEYYTVRLNNERDMSFPRVVPRVFSDRLPDSTSEAGYLYIGSHKPFPEHPDDLINGDHLPDDWIEERANGRRIRQSRRQKLPRHMRLSSSGEESADGVRCVYIPAPFLFCLNCGVSYSPRQSDFGKLATLSSEGRSSATTLLSLSAIRSLRSSDLVPNAQKLLSFTDNRQDASLQAGHFNDFIEVSLLRSAIYRAASRAGNEGLTHEMIAEKVFEALNLPIAVYASDPDVRFNALLDTQRALRQVLGYRIYRDLRRGWRIALPNLEQCGLLSIGYADLDAVCSAEDVWQYAHPALAKASSEIRMRVAKTLLDYMRRELAIKVDYLDPMFQERMRQSSSQRLQGQWAIDEDEKLEYATTLFPRPSAGEDTSSHLYVSARGGFGMYLRRTGTFTAYRAADGDKLDLEATTRIIRDLLEGLRQAGLVEITQPPRDAEDVPGYQLLASSMRWYAGDGTQAFHDPIRVPRASAEGGRPNTFFINFYREIADSVVGLEAREHTAQVPYGEREKREQQFRTGDLPILYCSPTMELGVDIAELNVVNLRNVPPTPANYAQRSGRAGRSGQPALVFTYCANGSPHDQYFFKRPEQMVAGAVAPPRLDLSNTDLLRAHIHAIWLAETGVDLKDTLKEILDMNGDSPSLSLLPDVQHLANDDAARTRARRRAEQVIGSISEVTNAAELLDSTLKNVALAFDHACQRWRGLYKSALKQAKAQEEIRRDSTRSVSDKRQAERLRREALSQIDLLTEVDRLAQSDFYSYRYFATEGFLPGYSFPRLPISAYIPARRSQQRDEFLSRPRFLAISEFGPRAIIYHEGSRYLINQVSIPVSENDEGPLTTQIKQCSNCGYVHPIRPGQNHDRCERCGGALDLPLDALMRLQNVLTRRRDRISADEEERLRLGYEIRTGVRFSLRGGQPDVRTAEVRWNDQLLARLTYAQTATIWRINLGWARRKQREQYGFVLDIENGYWARSENVSEEEDPLTDDLSQRTRRVIPYVEDNRNCLLFEPHIPLSPVQMASLQAALKRAIETEYQLEDHELAVEPLPDANNRRLILLYEAAEGGAGVLRRLIDDSAALRKIARCALQVCHFDPDTLDDVRRAPRAREDCEAACYDCLLSYGNQREHPMLDRQQIRDVLGMLANANVAGSPTTERREDHLEILLRGCESELERDWLRLLHERGLRLPDQGQVYIEDCSTRPDFMYTQDGVYAAVYIDGSFHDYPHRQARDQKQADCLTDLGYTVIRFGYQDDWSQVLDKHAYLFGEGR